MSTYVDVYRYRELFGNLFRRDLQAKYRGSALGIVWTIANPLLLMAVYLLVFGVIWNSPFANGGHYPLFLLSGLAVWTFVAAALQSSSRSMLDNANLIRKTRFPRQLVPLSVVGAHLVSFAAMLAILLVVNFVVLSRVRATEWLAIPLAAARRRLRRRDRADGSVAQRDLPRRRVHHRGAARAVVLPHAGDLPAVDARPPPARRLGDPLAEPAVADRHSRSARRSSTASCRRSADTIYAIVVCFVSLAIGAWVFRRVDDQIAIEV